jgi:hypothetical protein
MNNIQEQHILLDVNYDDHLSLIAQDLNHTESKDWGNGNHCGTDI